MTEKFTWGDEIQKKENLKLKEIPATEKEYNEYMTNKMNSTNQWRRLRLLEEVAERDSMKDNGFELKYYKIGEEIHWSTTLKK